jgi:DeoR/GlpR family transcriptional regulator of sugar metabolism
MTSLRDGTCEWQLSEASAPFRWASSGLLWPRPGMGMLFLIGITVAERGPWSAVAEASSPVGFIAQDQSMAEQHAEERYAHLLDLLSRQPIASVDDIRNATGASTAAIRRDLTLLESRGLVRRVRGGASLVAASSDFFAFPQRREHRLSGRRRTDRPGTAGMGGHLGTEHRRTPGDRGGHGGGADRRNSARIVVRHERPAATAALSQLSADAALLGCDGLDFDLGPRWNNLLDAEVAAVMGRQARRVIVLADGSKVDNVGRAGIVSWSDVDLVVTNELDATWRDMLRDRNVDVLETG